MVSPSDHLVCLLWCSNHLRSNSLSNQSVTVDLEMDNGSCCNLFVFITNTVLGIQSPSLPELQPLPRTTSSLDGQMIDIMTTMRCMHLHSASAYHSQFLSMLRFRAVLSPLKLPVKSGLFSLQSLNVLIRMRFCVQTLIRSLEAPF